MEHLNHDVDLRGDQGNIIECDPSSCHLNISIFLAQKPHLLKLPMATAQYLSFDSGPVDDYCGDPVGGQLGVQAL